MTPEDAAASMSIRELRGLLTNNSRATIKYKGYTFLISTQMFFGRIYVTVYADWTVVRMVPHREVFPVTKRFEK